MAWSTRTYGKLLHIWVGIDFGLERNQAIRSLTQEFIQSVLGAFQLFLRGGGAVKCWDVRSMVGKAARVAQVISEAMPYTASL